ncbi:MAG TPA: YifB family Mg chelatase-like AAA ATPase, partial [Longimicrobiales bacterium]|nr:YifB family Mg chelatase-like AAA ATPase [Longimicrobiales bacterium]
MLARVVSGAILGVDAFLVDVEVDIANGLPAMNVVGLPEGAVREGRERVSAAVNNTGFKIPPRRITINLAPADVKKDGSAFDLPIAIGILTATEDVPACARTCFLGELGLDGELRPVRGILSVAIRCRAEQLGRLIVPAANAREAAVIEGVEVCGAKTLSEVVDWLRGRVSPRVVRVSGAELAGAERPSLDLDYADVKGQEHARRAIEVAAAGQHNLLLIGPPGAGKSMLARRIPSILPPLSFAESLEVTRIHSVAGRLRPGQALVLSRPFRAPHHTISDAGLVGGGSTPRPGEVSLAHHGVLFLDELPEFRRHVLDALRQPLEDGVVQIGRARQVVSYPAQFMLAAAMNPCPCGFFGTAQSACTCALHQVLRYMARISGPLFDRIDLQVMVPAVSARELTARGSGESSAAIRARVEAARMRQLERFCNRNGVFANAHMSARDVRELCAVEDRGVELLRAAIQKL